MKNNEPPFAKREEKPLAETKSQVKTEALVAIPTAERKLCAHFGHCEVFSLVKVENGKIAEVRELPPPPHEPGVLPKWLSEQGATMVITGGMGSRAQDLFREFGIEVIVGAPVLTPDEVVERYLAGTLATGENICDH